MAAFSASLAPETVAVTLEIPAAALVVHAAPPALVTQHNAEAHLGYPRRLYLERVREFAAAGGVVLSDGKVRGVEPAPFVAWLRARASTLATAEPSSPLDALLADLGLVAVVGGELDNVSSGSSQNDGDSCESPSTLAASMAARGGT